MQYVELHARSAFSFLEGASLPEALIAAGAERGISAMAILDRHGVYGAPRFHLTAEKYRIKAHIGAEVSIAESGNYPLLAATRGGYQNLCRLITTAKLRIPKMRASKKTVATSSLAELQEHAKGLICLTGDETGPLALTLNNDGLDGGRELLLRLIEIFGRENIYVELQRHGDRVQEARNQAAIELARELHLPLLATNGVCYATPAEREVADAFTCIKNKRRLDTAGQLLAHNSQRYVRSTDEMTALFADLPEAIVSTGELSSRIEFTLKNLGYEFPRYPVPDGETMDSFLHKRTWDGARCRYRPVSARVRTQLEKELALIEKLKLSGYFLIVWDLVCFCERNGILVQGRGSAANSAVCYSLGITAIDPISMDLLFERFLSEERGEWPDIDLDLPSGDEREKVIQYVYERYGKRGAAMTANVCTYRGRSAAREMGKVLGFDEDTLARLSAIVGTWEWRDPNDTMERQFTNTGLDLRNPQIATYLDLCQRVQDLPRHLSQHSGGMVICQGQLDSVVPLEPATMPGRVVVQWDKDDCADLGLIKVDLLGLGMMAVLKDSIGLIQEHYGEEVDLAHLPQDCPDVYETVRKADTIGMFQIESCAQMASLPRNNPVKFYDLVTQVALIRPGPITGEMTSPYLKRRQGKEPVTYPHESLIPVLKRTLGVPLFQEQLLKLAMICANFSGGEAEELRRALGSKRSKQRMREIDAKLRAGMTANGIPPQTQDQLAKFISSFALYGFPESHAASFALIAYASAFLKVRYLGAFTAALLNNWPMGFYHPATIVKDAQRHGLRVLPVDVTCSEWKCTLESVVPSAAKATQRDGDSIAALKRCATQHHCSFALRMGLRYVRGMQQASAEALVQQRTLAPFSSIEDLAHRVPQLNRDNLATLASIGALNHLSADAKLHRRDALWQVEKAVRRSGPLLEGIVALDEASPLKQMDVEERLVADYHGTGLTTGHHPMAYRREVLRARGVRSAIELRQLPHGIQATTAGCVITRQRPGTAKGLIFMTLEDETGTSRVIISPDFYDQNRMVVLKERFVLVSGIVQNQDNIVHLKARHIQPLTISAATVPSHDFH
ncbi:MAG TPA: error-prone DNA polymerase [Terriglobales bacterium]|nr:error-prone DNA polymerase [Terriglobales bacterium]